MRCCDVLVRVLRAALPLFLRGRRLTYRNSRVRAASAYVFARVAPQRAIGARRATYFRAKYLYPRASTSTRGRRHCVEEGATQTLRRAEAEGSAYHE